MPNDEKISNLEKKICELEKLQSSYILTSDIKTSLVENMEENKNFQSRLESKFDELLKKDNKLMLILNNKYIFIIIMTFILSGIFFVNKLMDTSKSIVPLVNSKKVK